MRQLCILIAALWAAGAVADTRYLEVAQGTNSAASATFDGFQGIVEAIYVDCPATCTGNVSITYQPHVSGMTAVTLAATNSVSTDKTFRPCVYLTASNGTNVTAEGAIQYYLSGETVTFTTASSTTGVTWKAWLVFSP